MIEIAYEPDGRTLEEYLFDQARVALIQGPRGSGKSTASAKKVGMNALQQWAAPDGLIHRRTYAVRNTYDELERTTIKTWLMHYPENTFGRIKRSKPPQHDIFVGNLRWEVMFLALDKPDDVKKLLSTECSDVWLNEFRELPRQVIDDVDPIIGRYPSVAMGGCHLPQICGDTNAPPDSHWFSYMSGQSIVPDDMGEDERLAVMKPAGWSFHMQPPGLLEERDGEGLVIGYRDNQAAENLKWLPQGYYRNLIEGKTRQWIRVNVLNKPGQIMAGKPVWPQFRREVHVAREPLQPIPGHIILVGVDFGRTPSAIFCQRVFGRWRVLREIVTNNTSVKDFSRVVLNKLAEWFPGYGYQAWGDPAGENMEQSDDYSPMLVCRANGFLVLEAPTNDFVIRREAIASMFGGLVDGQPEVLLSPNVPTLIEACEGGYHYRRMQVSGEIYADRPVKNRHSHPADAFQYVAIGAGEGRALTSMARSGMGGRAPFTPPRRSVFERRGGRR